MSGGSKAPPSSTTTVNQLYSPEEAAARAKVMAQAEQIYGQTAGNANIPGPAMSADTLASQNMMRNVAAGQPLAGQADMLRGAQQFGLQDVLDPTSSPGFQASLDTATRKVGEAYQSPTGPFAGIRTASQTQNSGGSGTREGIAMGMAGRDYLNTIGDVTGRMTSDAYGKGLDTFSRTLGLAPNTQGAIMGAEMNPASITGAIGQQNEAYAAQQREWELNSPWAALGPYANIVGGMSAPGTQSTSTGSAPQNNPMAPLGAAMMGASAGAAFGPTGALVGGTAGLLMSMFMK